MTVKEYLSAIEKSKGFRHSSMRRLDFSDVCRFQIEACSDDILLLYGLFSEIGLYGYHWAANDVEVFFKAINKQKNILVPFIPQDWVRPLKEFGFAMYAEWHDYFMNDIPEIEKEEEVEFLSEEESEQASAVTRLCRGLSRGFVGQSAEWISKWLNGDGSSDIKNNAIIIQRNHDHDILGIVCTATYAHNSEKGAVVWIREVAVKPEHQRQGIGRKLILQALSYGKAHGAKRAFLAADECNLSAIRLYKNIGFEPSGDEPQIDMIRITV